MKKSISYVALLALLLSLGACNNKKTDEATPPAAQAEEAIDNTATQPDTTVVPQAEEATQQDARITVSGTVTEVNRGKDGYTATLKAADGKEYKATISIPNLTDPKEYRSVEKGETIKVEGEFYGDDNMIKVEKLY
ncbi:hypothetical protein [Flavobacterium rhizosphaerae]|uniref:tRNA_anti-like n=1 Tax=Flavobacterium rhizosphaerae TaxID=3163298 RepID=A0ABW8Z136_9FLAO